jgi:hypothetical protein
MCFPSVLLTKRTTKQAISAAKELGNVGAVKQLFNAADRSNFRWELVDLVFFHLQAQRVETSPPQGGATANGMERATALARAASFCASDGMSIILAYSPQSSVHGLFGRSSIISTT